MVALHTRTSWGHTVYIISFVACEPGLVEEGVKLHELLANLDHAQRLESVLAQRQVPFVQDYQ